MNKNILNEVSQLICRNPELLEMISEDIHNSANIKLAMLDMHLDKEHIMEKLANSFRDMVAMGRTPRFKGMNQFQSFNRLRNTKVYMPYNNYNAFDGSIMAQTAGLDYSAIDGGFGNFKSLKQLRRHLNKIMRNTNELMRETTLSNTDKWKLNQNEYLDLLTRYFPNMNLFQDYRFPQLIYKKLVQHLNNEYLNAANAYGPAY